MAFTSAKMGLKIWNLLTDLYDHAQLADNWAKVDYHDHSPGKGVQIPTEGIADGAITGAKLADVLDPSDAFTQWRTLFFGGATLAPASGSTYGFLGDSVYTVGAANSARAAFHIEPGEFAVAGRVAKMRLIGTLITNTVTPGTNINTNLYPVNFGGATSGNGPIIASVGSAVGGGMAFVTQGANSAARGASFDFDVPDSGWYTMGINANSTVAAGSVVDVQLVLQVHYV